MVVMEESTSDRDEESRLSGAEDDAESVFLKRYEESDFEQVLGTHRETKFVLWLKLLVLLILVTSAVCVALFVYFYTSRGEYNQFEERFYDDAHKVLGALGSGIDLTLGAIDSYAVSIVSYARNSNQTWPFVTVPDFAVRMAKIRALSEAVVASHYHFVEGADREKWEEYSIENQAWVDEGLRVQQEDESFHGLLWVGNYTVSEHIYNNYGVTDSDGPFLPIWQSYPVIPTYPPFNWDGFNYSAIVAAKAVLFTDKKVVIGTVSNIPSETTSSLEAEVTTDWVKDYIPPDENPAEPYSEILYPVLANAPDAVTATSGNSTENAVVCVIALSVFWRDLIKDILPSDSDGLVCVFDNDCGQSFTYQINGPDVVYLGQGDLHDRKYDHLELSSDLSNLDAFNTKSSSTYSGPHLSSDYCAYHVHMYASEHMEAGYITNDPARFTIVAVLIFAFSSAIFLVYDKCVEKRQRKVMFKALTSSANVSMLEEKVKERTCRLERSNQQLEEANQQVRLASAKQLQHFACMSHEIRTPLNCIIGVSSLLQETELEPSQQDSVKMIVDSGDLLLAVVNDVLDYSRLESGEVDIVIRKCSLQDTLNSVVRSMEAKGKLKGVSIRTKLGTNVGEFICTDKQRLQQILFNLLGNAVKFSKDYGVVELSAHLFTPLLNADDLDTSKTLTNSVDCQADNVKGGRVIRFVVKDYGKGIERQNFPKIFQPFLQANTDTEQLYGGTGLGLAITSRLVEGLNGSISVDSVVGEWSEFTVDLPGDGAEVDVDTIASDLKDSTILLIASDEDGSLVNQMTNVFQDYRISFQSFANMSELRENRGTLNRDQLFAFVVQEDLFDKAIYAEMSSDMAKSVLISFGPLFAVKEATLHYRSLPQVLPSVLMKSIGSCLQDATHSTREGTAMSTKGAPGSKMFPYGDLKVLIAEDNRVNQKVLARILKRLGIQNVTIVENGQVAVDREAKEAFDVVLMDMQMPVMDGVDACRLICSRQGGHSRPRVVFVTAHVSPSFEAECLEAGGCAFLPKPFRLVDVEKCLESLEFVREDQ